jgi:hypothetical protein
MTHSSIDSIDATIPYYILWSGGGAQVAFGRENFLVPSVDNPLSFLTRCRVAAELRGIIDGKKREEDNKEEITLSSSLTTSFPSTISSPLFTAFDK